MDFIEIVLLLLGLISPCFLWSSIKGTISDIRKIKRCSVETMAEILSWRIEEDSDNPTQCTPTIRYSFHNQVYEVEFEQGTVTKYQKERYYTEDTVTIFVDPDDPANITPENKGHSVFRSIESCILVCGMSLFFLLLAIFVILN